MSGYSGWIVRSTAGHHKGDLFCAGGPLDRDGGKKRKPTRPVHAGWGEASDRALRRALAAFREELRRV